MNQILKLLTKLRAQRTPPIPRTPRRLTLALLCLTFGGAFISTARAQVLAAFSTLQAGQALPKPFRVIRLPGASLNTFSLVSDEGQTVLRVESRNSAGSLGVPVPSEAQGNKVLQWRWKVDRLMDSADMGERSNDDHPARVYVFFDVPLESLSAGDRTKIRLARTFSGEEVPTAALCYVWDNKHRVGYTTWSPFTKRIRRVVLQSGPASVGQWRTESRDVAADFREAFGMAAPAITGVAVGNDSDNTDDHVVTWFGDIAFVK